MDMEKNSFEEKRRDIRFASENLRIILKDDKNFKGESIRDISLGGVFVRTENPHERGTVLMLTLDPRMGLGGIKLKGQVVAINRGEYPYDKGMHVKFMDMPSYAQEKLEKLFKELRKA